MRPIKIKRKQEECKMDEVVLYETAEMKLSIPNRFEHAIVYKKVPGGWLCTAKIDVKVVNDEYEFFVLNQEYASYQEPGQVRLSFKKYTMETIGELEKDLNILLSETSIDAIVAKKMSFRINGVTAIDMFIKSFDK